MKIRKTMCASCIFRPGSPLADRVAVHEPTWREQDTHQTCHASAIGDNETDELYDPESGETVEPSDAAVCRGFYEQVFMQNGTGQLLRIMGRLNALEFSDD